MSKKLVIKINNLEALDEDAIAKKHEVEVLLWGRIIGFAAVVIIVFGGIVAWIFSGNSDDVEPGVLAQINNSQSSPAAGLAMPPAYTQPDLDDSSGLSVDSAKPKVSTPVPEKVRAVERDKPASSAPKKVAATDNAPQINEGKQASIAPPLEEPRFQPAEIKLLADGVVKAQLTHQLDRNKFPVDELGRIVSMNGESLIRVYLFTELENLSGKTMYHSWYRNGDRMAKVRIPVIKEKYHASSSKFIDRFMLGDWQVKITDDDGKSYADVKFTVKDS